EAANPFEYCDVVTTTTHKSLRGPRAGMIFYSKGPKPPKKGQPEGAVYDYEDKINFAVFPSLQGGPHNHQIAALVVALQQTMSPGFKAYAKQVKVNAVAIGNYLMSKGYKMVTDGTENHLVLWDLRPLGLTGNKVEKLCDLCHITLNKNVVFGDSSALSPGGVRIVRLIVLVPFYFTILHIFCTIVLCILSGLSGLHSKSRTYFIGYGTASELETSMIETLEAVEIEKQKHHSTRMEALARLARLDVTNGELAKSLAREQWNLEVQVDQVAQLQEEVELKKLAQDKYRRKLTKIQKTSAPLVDEIESLRRFKLEEEIID
ncbi:hypothetical protein ACJX0J_042115, partial [Zea mays]